MRIVGVDNIFGGRGRAAGQARGNVVFGELDGVWGQVDVVIRGDVVLDLSKRKRVSR